MNIQTMLLKLSAKGMTDSEIGEKIGATQSIVYRLRTGAHKSTSYERGEAIRKLYESKEYFMIKKTS